MNKMKNNLRTVREDKGITRYKMAKDLEKPYQTIQYWEDNENLAPKNQKICAEYLGMKVSDIFKI